MEDKLEQLRIAAESGDMNAINEYAWELVDHKKLSDAFKWFEMSKDLNDPYRFLGLGICYLYGKGNDKNIKEAINCFLRVLELGEIRAVVFIFGISHLYDEHINFDEVVRIFEKLNNNFSTDNADADYIKFNNNIIRYMLACCYYWGVGTEKNEGQAKKLLKSAGYDFDEDNTPLFIKKIIMAFPFPKRFPICYNFLRPFQEKIKALFSMSFKWFYYGFVESNISSNEATAKELYDFLIEKDHDGRWFYIKELPKVNANLMDIALLENNFSNFCDVCLKEPNFIECVLLHDRFINTFQYIDDPLCISHPEFDIENKANFDLDKSHRFIINVIGFNKINNLFKKYNSNILEPDLPELIYGYIELITTCLSSIFILHSAFKIGIIEEIYSLNEEEYRLFKDLSHLVNQQEYSEEINELKKYCINTPKIPDGVEFTKEILSSIFGIVDESPVDIDETVNFKDAIIPDTYKCEIFDGCEEAYKKFFEKLKSIDYIDKSTSFDSFKIAIGLVPKTEDGVFKRVIWKSMYVNRAYWKPLLNMLRLIGIKREDLKPKTLNSLFVHSTGKKIDSNVIKVHKATALIEFNGKKQSIHKHLCDFLEKSGFPSDKLIHNLDE